jgi:hypothetical protein
MGREDSVGHIPTYSLVIVSKKLHEYECQQTRSKDVKFLVFTSITTKNTVFWNATPYGSC